MTTSIYVPVPITSAEQADALPVGTVATHAKGSGMDHAHKLFPPLGRTESPLWVSLTGLVSNAGMVGWTALVPVEAEEEWGTTANGHTLLQDQLTEEEAWSAAQTGATPVRRLNTPWEEA